MPMYNPAHPGLLIKTQLIEDEEGYKISSIAEVADKLHCHRSTLNRVINGSAAITPSMALALEKIGAGSAEHWLAMQASYDLFQLRNSHAA